MLEWFELIQYSRLLYTRNTSWAAWNALLFVCVLCWWWWWGFLLVLIFLPGLICYVLRKCVSPWYNRHGGLGVKNQIPSILPSFLQTWLIYCGKIESREHCCAVFITSVCFFVLFCFVFFSFNASCDAVWSALLLLVQRGRLPRSGSFLCIARSVRV